MNDRAGLPAGKQVSRPFKAPGLPRNQAAPVVDAMRNGAIAMIRPDLLPGATGIASGSREMFTAMMIAAGQGDWEGKAPAAP